MSKNKMIFGFHAVTSRLRHEASSVEEIFVDIGRDDRRMKDLVANAKAAGVRVMPVDSARLDKIVGTRRHQGVIAFASQLSLARNLDELLDAIDGPPLLLVLDGITDPHNLGACLRVADGVGAHAVIVPKDRAVGLNATAAKVASGAAETVPYITVTNLARTLRDLKDRDIWLIGTSDDGEKGFVRSRLHRPDRAGHGFGRRGHAPPDARDLRHAGLDPDVRFGREPERLRRIRRLSVRSAPPAYRQGRLVSLPADSDALPAAHFEGCRFPSRLPPKASRF
jgi:23S rRNA (guanosine2251-2'-O)-methyltransferase